MEDLASPVGAFVRERCFVATGERVETGDLFAAWRAWCEAHGRREPGTEQTFGRDLRAAVPTLGKSRPRTPEGRLYYYLNIRLRRDSDPEHAEEHAGFREHAEEHAGFREHATAGEHAGEHAGFLEHAEEHAGASDPVFGPLGPHGRYDQALHAMRKQEGDIARGTARGESPRAIGEHAERVEHAIGGPMDHVDQVGQDPDRPRVLPGRSTLTFRNDDRPDYLRED
jgi:hypothetical protein